MEKIGKISPAILVLIAIITLIFGNNIYKQITGHSLADDLQRPSSISSPSPISPPVFDTETPTLIYFSDDFNSGTEFNQSFWKIDRDEECNVQLKDAQVEFSSTGLNKANSLCRIHTEETTFEQLGSVEAKIRTSGGATGDYSIGIIEVTKGTFQAGTKNWIIQCGILQNPNNQNQIEVFFNVHSTYPQGEPEIFISSPASTWRWYSLQLKIAPESDEIVCYADNKVIGSYEGDNIVELHHEKLDRNILGFWSPYSQAYFFVDDVILSPPD